jgi:lipocalin
MRHEKILKRDDGSRVKIVVFFYCDFTSLEATWNYEVSFCEPRKKSWTPATDRDDYLFRKLDRAGKEAEKQRQALLRITQQELYDTMRELWLKLEPKPPIEKG